MAGNPITERRRPRRRWRILRRLSVLTAVLLVVLTVASVIVYQRRVEFVNRYLASSNLPFAASVGSLDVSGLSSLSMTGVELRLPGSENPFLTFSSSATNLSLDDLLGGHLADLKIANANIHVNDELLATLTGTKPKENGTATPPRSLLISNLDLENAAVTLQLDGLPKIAFALNHQGENIRIGSGLPVTGPQKLQLSDITATLDGATSPAAQIPSLDIGFTSGGEAGGLHIETLDIDSPSLTFTRRLLVSLAAPPGKPATPPRQKKRPFPVTIDAIAIRNCHLTTPAGIQPPTSLPFELPAGTATLSVNGGPLTLATDGTITAAPQTITATASLGDLLTIRSLSANVAATDGLVTIASLTADTHLDLPPTATLPATKTDLRLDLTAITLAPDGPRSTSPQSLNLTNLSATLGNSSARLASLITTLRPDTLRESKRIDSLIVSGVQLEIDPADLPAREESTPGSPPVQPAWHGLGITDLTVSQGSVETAPAPHLGIPGASATIEVATTAKTPQNSTYRTTLKNLRLTSNSTTLATARAITVDADPTSLWTRNHITRLAVDGVNLTLGQDLLDATRPPEKTGGASGSPQPPPPESRAWTLGELALTQSTVIVDDLVPGLPPLPLAVSTTLTDIPLSSAGMQAASKHQSVTVSNARLRSRLNPLLDVARFDKVTFHFTFHDIIHQKIDRISIDHPVLFVGEHLFWYVDYFRKFESPAATGNPSSPGWDVRTVEANDGELVLAPKGAPLTELPKLPFSGKTSIVDSKLSFAIDSEDELGQDISEERPLLSLSVPEGDYPLKSLNLGLEIDLKGLRGDIAFNLPIQQRTNNLVQTLHANELWFKNIGARQVYLAVTYDQQGIYAQFGGEAYGGYAKGAFNLYNDDAYSWDGWVTGTTMELSPLTTALTPKYLEMTGVADASLIAQGNFESFDDITATASVTTAEGGGKIDVLVLGDLGESLVAEAEPIAAALTKAGLDVVRYFDYDKAKIDVEMFGREGDAILDLRGPSGLRHIHITAHDYRNHTTAQ